MGWSVEMEEGCAGEARWGPVLFASVCWEWLGQAPCHRRMGEAGHGWEMRRGGPINCAVLRSTPMSNFVGKLNKSTPNWRQIRALRLCWNTRLFVSRKMFVLQLSHFVILSAGRRGGREGGWTARTARADPCHVAKAWRWTAADLPTSNRPRRSTTRRGHQRTTGQADAEMEESRLGREAVARAPR